MEEEYVKSQVMKLCPDIDKIPGANQLSELGSTIEKAIKAMIRLKLKILHDFDLTPPQFDLLFTTFMLSASEDEINQIKLSQKSLIDPMTISTMLRNLENRGLVIRGHSKIDTRARVVEITEKGKECLSKALVKLTETYSNIFSKMDKEVMLKHFVFLYDEINEFSNKLNKE